MELHLFRIIQEAVNNITKHARAKLIRLQLQVSKDAVVLKIQDDGQGFDPVAVEAGRKIRHGLGLTNMRERALAMDGECEINAQPGRGTSILVRVPLSRDQNSNARESGKSSAKKSGKNARARVPNKTRASSP